MLSGASDSRGNAASYRTRPSSNPTSETHTHPAPTIPPYTGDPCGSWVHPHSCRGLRGPRLPPHLPVSSLALPGPAPLGSDGVRWFSHGPKWRLIRRRNLLPIKKPAQSPQTACPPQNAFPSPRGTISGSSLGKRVGSHGLPLPASKSTTSH